MGLKYEPSSEPLHISRVRPDEQASSEKKYFLSIIMKLTSHMAQINISSLELPMAAVIFAARFLKEAYRGASLIRKKLHPPRTLQ